MADKKLIDIDRLSKYHENINTLLTTKQESLVSGTNIKTINGESIVGSGNIEINGGNPDANVSAVDTSETLDDVSGNTYVKYVAQTLTEEQKAQVRENIGVGNSTGGNGTYSEVSHGTADATFALTPNTFHIWDEVSALALTLGAETSGVANEYLFQFTSGSTATTLSLPDDIKWAGGEDPAIEANKIYQISILKGLGSVLEFDNFVNNVFFIDDKIYYFEIGMTWEQWVNSAFNTDNYSVSENKILDNTLSREVSNVTKTDLISLHYSYTLITGGFGPA